MPKKLKGLGIRRSHWSNVPLWLLLLLLVIVATVASVLVLTRNLDSDTAVPLFAVILTVAGLLVAVLQWRHGLAEKGFDSLYQRIELANRVRLEAFKEANTSEEEQVAEGERELYRFYVFTEIDSLEYAMRRYRAGFGLKADIVERAVNHFRGRCKSSTIFATTAEACADDGAYFEDTKVAVRSILDEVIIELAYEALRKRDIDAALKLMQPDVECPSVDGESERGHVAVRAYLTRQFEAGSLEFSPERYEHKDDGVVIVDVRHVGDDSKSVEISNETQKHEFTLHDRLIARMVLGT